MRLTAYEALVHARGHYTYRTVHLAVRLVVGALREIGLVPVELHEATVLTSLGPPEKGRSASA